MAGNKPQKIKIRIVENSIQARLAAWYLHSHNVALVLGSRIHLWGVNRQQFLSDTTWVKHELKHIEQFRKHGYFLFLWKYFFETIRHGYFNNRFEEEARTAENMPVHIEQYDMQ